MSPRRGVRRALIPCFPRVSGDEPPNGYDENYVRGFSPRERG